MTLNLVERAFETDLHNPVVGFLDTWNVTSINKSVKVLIEFIYFTCGIYIIT